MEATKKKIIDAAIVIFNNDPSAGLEAVADKANITTRTLFRYFKDRAVLLEHCRQEMTQTCKAAMMAAFDASDIPLKQLELTLYACIDCGSKYAFYDKMNQQSSTAPLISDFRQEYFSIQKKWFDLITALQKKGMVTDFFTVEWIYQLFSGMITVTLQAINTGTVALGNVKKFAWYAFSQSIGIKTSEIK
ncbi:TetR/AcrR family transcriptional regulator [Mucilaginibacter sp. SMC90]|uniref:TetR/AcrR family transcriptional regulator n=1 Tax=Mucilaginibacter sp. SMC90 TaxID=2929803 RepID=UPI001FB253F5|nr:TetR/AcrR family transcriptional regulator [Mucilaginibacter sp. SMC90]UOE51367.1 TetR/AcrR family transcriptional regulator [Mucilaginibacter sp. SMC90]